MFCVVAFLPKHYMPALIWSQSCFQLNMTRQDLKLYDESFQKLRGDVSETTVSSGDVIILVDVITCRAFMWGCCSVVYPVCFVLSSVFPSGKHSNKLSVLLISNLGEVWNKELLNQLSSLPTAVSMRCFSGCLNTAFAPIFCRFKTWRHLFTWCRKACTWQPS